MKNIYGKMMNLTLTEKVKEFIRQKHGKVKNLYGNAEDFYRKLTNVWKSDEFVWKSGRIYMVHRYSKYRFFDVNCVQRHSKYRFSSSIPGMPGEAKISIPYSMWVKDIIYIYKYTCCSLGMF